MCKHICAFLRIASSQHVAVRKIDRIHLRGFAYRLRMFFVKLSRDAQSLNVLQIDQVKGGKQLANLPTISVPMPPPAPESFRFDETYMQIPSPSGCHSSFAINGSPYWDAQEMGDVGKLTVYHEIVRLGKLL